MKHIDAEIPGRTDAQCTVAICTRHRSDLLARCLDAVRQQAHRSFRILVVDNGPDDPQTRKVVKERGVAYVAAPIVGLSRARNVALRVSTTPFVAYLDDDAVPDPDWLLHLTEPFRDESVGFVTSRVIDSVTDARGVTSVFSRGGEDPWGITPESPDWFSCVNFGWIGDGGAFAVRKKALEEVGGFSLELGRGALLGGSEEHYAFFSIIKAGYAGVYVPNSIVRHLPAPKSIDRAGHRILEDVTNGSAYVTKLFIEEPNFGLELLTYLLRRKRSRQRPPALVHIAGTVPAWRISLAVLAGPWRYLRSRLRSPLLAPAVRQE